VRQGHRCRRGRHTLNGGERAERLPVSPSGVERLGGHEQEPRSVATGRTRTPQYGRAGWVPVR
jgi:hypothetical protein